MMAPQTRMSLAMLNDPRFHGKACVAGHLGDWRCSCGMAENLAYVEEEAMIEQHLMESEGRCMCGAKDHSGDCHFGWHKPGCKDA